MILNSPSHDFSSYVTMVTCWFLWFQMMDGTPTDERSASTMSQASSPVDNRGEYFYPCLRFRNINGVINCYYSLFFMCNYNLYVSLMIMTIFIEW